MMDSQQQSFRSKRTVNTASETWTAHNEMIPYTVDSQQNLEDQNRVSPCLYQANSLVARNHQRLPFCRNTPGNKLPSCIMYQSPCSLSEHAPPPDMLIPSCRHFSEPQRLALRNAKSHPPVTKASLMELDLNCIFHNINLRSDINFENDLHFMPIGGRRADQKRKEAQEYWLALAAELQMHLHARFDCSHSQHSAGESFTPRLPQMFADLRELLEILVPDRDHISIADNLDLPFLMQQVENGLLDIPRLAKWFASLLKSHCAPMRDEWVNHMTQQVEEGARTSEMSVLVDGIQKLFSVLEAMKLDVANHQIRTFRFLLMENSIAFQQKFFAERIVDGRIDSTECHRWYNEAKYLHTLWSCSNPTSSSDAYAGLIYGIISTLFNIHKPCNLPMSFQYDLKRLERIRSDIQDLIHLKMCLHVLDKLTLGRSTAMCSNACANLQGRILAIVDEKPDDEDPWQISSADVALEITRAACMICGHSGISIPDCWIQFAQCRLDELISGQTSECALFGETLQELAAKAIYYAQIFNDMTTLSMSHAQQQWQRQQEQKPTWHPLPDMEDIARRLAHVGAIHWKIWAGMVYLDEAEQVHSPKR